MDTSGRGHHLSRGLRHILPGVFGGAGWRTLRETVWLEHRTQGDTWLQRRTRASWTLSGRQRATEAREGQGQI